MTKEGGRWVEVGYNDGQCWLWLLMVMGWPAVVVEVDEC